MNTQEIFDKVARHLLQQGKVSRQEFRGCRYRIGKLRCAVGCLIKDEFYSDDLEGDSVEEPPVVQAVQDSIGRALTNDEISLLTQLQVIHDLRDVNAWPFHLQGAANRYKLAYNEALYV